MDIEQLRAFDQIARQGSFSRAARTLDIMQPTISARIQALEQELGGALFRRGGRKLALTEMGASFLPYVRSLLATLQDGVETARLAQTGQRGRLAIGALESFMSGFLATAVARFHSAYPQVDLFIRTGHSDQVVEMLRDGLVKLGLIAWPYFEPELELLLRLREPLLLAVPARHPLARERVVSVEQLRREARPLFIIAWSPAVRQQLSQLVARVGPVVELPIHMAHYLLLQGQGACFLTRTIAADDLASGRFVELEVGDLPPLSRESALVRLKSGDPLPQTAQAFLALFQDETRRAGVLEDVASTIL